MQRVSYNVELLELDMVGRGWDAAALARACSPPLAKSTVTRFLKRRRPDAADRRAPREGARVRHVSPLHQALHQARTSRRRRLSSSCEVRMKPLICTLAAIVVAIMLAHVVGAALDQLTQVVVVSAR
jgi:hypothetical protein